MNQTRQTIKSATNWGISQLLQSLPALSRSHAALESEILLAYSLHKNKEYLFAYPALILNSKQWQVFQNLIQRKAAAEPIAQITKQKEFYLRKFRVNNQVLIPRPETEDLITTALKIIAAWKAPRKVVRIADLGTGSGCIAITLAIELANLGLKCRIRAYDISPQALEVARTNWKRLRMGLGKQTDLARVSFYRKDILTDLLNAEFDLIISNPPYIPEPELSGLADTIKKFEPVLALHGGPDGLLFYRTIKTLLDQSLAKDGTSLLEMHAYTAKKIRAVFNKQYDSEIIYDLAGLPRILLLKHLPSTSHQ